MIHFKWKKKPGKKAVAAMIAAAVILLFVVYSSVARSRAASVHTDISATTLKKTTMQSSVSVSGKIESGDSHNVYTTLTYPVKIVNVKAGDTVKKGDVLAVLDTTGLESDVKQAQSSTEAAEKAAELALQQAKSDYENAASLYRQNRNGDILAAKSALDGARIDLKSAADAYSQSQFLYDNGQLSKTDLDQAAAKKQSAQLAYDKAESTLSLTRNKVEQDLKTLENAYESAQVKYADKSQRMALEKQEQALKDAVIVSPADGTVTTCAAAEGVVPAGVLFTVEDPGNLLVSAQVREYDVGSVKPGQRVTVATDATGSKKTEGIVQSVASASTAAAAGTVSGSGTAASGSPTFTVKVRVQEKNPALKIGMNARLNIILQEKANVYTVPYDALVEDTDGKHSVFAAEQDGSVWKAKKISVETGMENDVAVEISASALQDGMRIVSNPDSLTDGSTLVLAQGG